MALSPTSSRGGGTTVATDTIWDAKGDMVSGTGADAAARTAAGTDGTVWTADAASTAGAKWATASSGALTLLSTTTLGSSNTFDVTGISGSYNDLFLVVISRGARVSAADSLNLRFNNDTSNVYDSAHVITEATTVTAGGGINSNQMLIGWGIPAASATAAYFAHTVIEVCGYTSTTWNKSCLLKTVGNLVGTTAYYVQTSSGEWRSTAAITRVQIFGGITANLATGSQLRIYGRL